MAKICDLDQIDPATQTINFDFGGKSYVIHLCDRYADMFRATAAPYIAAARIVRKAPRRAKK